VGAYRQALCTCFGVFFTAQVAAGEELSLLSQGQKLLAEGRIPEAVETLQRATAEKPQSSVAFTRLGGAQVLGQDYAAAIESFKQAISLDPNNADAFVGMAVSYIHSARYALARAALVEAKRIDSSKEADVDKLVSWIDERMAN
jgi:tetratricopeptide (TPR) repeat protein